MLREYIKKAFRSRSEYHSLYTVVDSTQHVGCLRGFLSTRPRAQKNGGLTISDWEVSDSQGIKIHLTGAAACQSSTFLHKQPHVSAM